MQYQSPSSIFGDPIHRQLDKKAIQVGRKKLLAELELAATISIDIRGIPFTKNDIIDYYDKLIFENALSYHNAVEEDTALLKFLETGVISRRDKFRDNPLYSDAGFIRWVSPFFHYTFSSFVEECFMNTNEDGLSAILGNPLLMTDEDLEQVWTYVSRLLNDEISFLNDYQDETKPETDRPSSVAILPLMSTEHIRVIALLPETWFSEVKDRYALAIVQVCVCMFHRRDEEEYWTAWRYMNNAQLLASSPGVKDRIAGMLEKLGSSF